ncbi:Uncharacterised protein [Actinobacillus pleuropneumoniae]|nr:Uncharacterised protein [Actinobacillus pleuropneumoniae]
MNSKSRMIVQYTICLGHFCPICRPAWFNIRPCRYRQEHRFRHSYAQWIVTAYLLVISILLPVMGKLGICWAAEDSQYRLFVLWPVRYARFVPFINRADIFPHSSRHRSGHVSSHELAPSSPCFRRNSAQKRWVNQHVRGSWLHDRSESGRHIDSMVFVAEQFLAAYSDLAGSMDLRAAFHSEGRAGSRREPLDVPGAAFFAISLTGLVTAVNLGAQWGWGSWQVTLLFMMFGAGAAAFIGWCLSSRWERKGKGQLPFMKLDLFRDAGVSVGSSLPSSPIWLLSLRSLCCRCFCSASWASNLRRQG